MRRRRLLVCGSALLSSGLSGCLGSLNSAGENGEPTTNESTTRTTTRTTTDTGTEGLALANSSSKTRTAHVAVSRKSDPTPLVDAKYEVPSGHLLWFSETLEHGQSYRIDAEITGGKSRETTLTAEGCAGDPYNSSGSRPVIIYVGKQKPTIAFKECDVEFPPNRYTTEGTDRHEV